MESNSLIPVAKLVKNVELVTTDCGQEMPVAISESHIFSQILVSRFLI